MLAVFHMYPLIGVVPIRYYITDFLTCGPFFNLKDQLTTVDIGCICVNIINRK